VGHSPVNDVDETEEDNHQPKEENNENNNEKDRNRTETDNNNATRDNTPASNEGNYNNEHNEDDDDVQVQGDSHSEYSDINHQSTADATEMEYAQRGKTDISSGTVHETIKT
jgi:hypothetical protein